MLDAVLAWYRVSRRIFRHFSRRKSVQPAGSSLSTVGSFTLDLHIWRGGDSDDHFACPVVGLHDDKFDVITELNEFCFAAFEDGHLDLLLSE